MTWLAQHRRSTVIVLVLVLLVAWQVYRLTTHTGWQPFCGDAKRQSNAMKREAGEAVKKEDPAAVAAAIRRQATVVVRNDRCFAKSEVDDSAVLSKMSDEDIMKVFLEPSPASSP